MTWIWTPPARCPDEMFDHDRVLITFVLQSQRVLGFVDELSKALTPISYAPDEV
jgi:hypothetical protein